MERSPEPGAAGGAWRLWGWASLTRSPIAGCRCDVGGALGQSCELRTGACMCRPNTQGSTCSEWVPHPGWAGGVGWGSSLCTGFSLGTPVCGAGPVPVPP